MDGHVYKCLLARFLLKERLQRYGMELQGLRIVIVERLFAKSWPKWGKSWRWESIAIFEKQNIGERSNWYIWEINWWYNSMSLGPEVSEDNKMLGSRQDDGHVCQYCQIPMANLQIP